jgi:hypothetical protein
MTFKRASETYLKDPVEGQELKLAKCRVLAGDIGTGASALEPWPEHPANIADATTATSD